MWPVKHTCLGYLPLGTWLVSECVYPTTSDSYLTHGLRCLGQLYKMSNKCECEQGWSHFDLFMLWEPFQRNKAGYRWWFRSCRGQCHNTWWQRRFWRLQSWLTSHYTDRPGNSVSHWHLQFLNHLQQQETANWARVSLFYMTVLKGHIIPEYEVILSALHWNPCSGHSVVVSVQDPELPGTQA